ncbi:hypothetical protein AT807_25175 [Salmonella enterica]|nr:hypothetical protein [Salmonella enterica]
MSGIGGVIGIKYHRIKIKWVISTHVSGIAEVILSYEFYYMDGITHIGRINECSGTFRRHMLASWLSDIIFNCKIWHWIVKMYPGTIFPVKVGFFTSFMTTFILRNIEILLITVRLTINN